MCVCVLFYSYLQVMDISLYLYVICHLQKANLGVGVMVETTHGRHPWSQLVEVTVKVILHCGLTGSVFF